MAHGSFLEEVIFQTTGKNLAINNITNQGGGCINKAVTVETGEGRFFIKYNTDVAGDMFEKEFRGLLLLKESGLIRVPEPLKFGNIGNTHYLTLEAITGGYAGKTFWTDFGSGLAKMHRDCSSDQFGLDYDNYIGRLPQQNRKSNRWLDFFTRCRLDYQVRLAVKNRHIDSSLADKFRVFYTKLPSLLPEGKPSLLHGDLWSGNFMTGNDGRVVLIDPAVYYGNREAEISFTLMFGGFEEDFYNAYRDTWPLDSGFDERVDIYNLYPTLVHLNLFGSMYLGGITRVIDHYV